MQLAQSVRGHLPALRRYARALTGSQESGDAYVAATLEAVVKQPTLVSADGDTRVDMFRTFTRIWNSVPLNAEARDAATFPPERRLAQISALPRQAFLLTSLEMSRPPVSSTLTSPRCARSSISSAASLPIRSRPMCSSSRTKLLSPLISSHWLKALVTAL